MGAENRTPQCFSRRERAVNRQSAGTDPPFPVPISAALACWRSQDIGNSVTV
jgi:hypothetical protein